MIKLKKQICQIRGAFLRLQNIRKGSKVSRLGRYLVEKANPRYFTGLLLMLIVPLGSLANPVLSQAKTVNTIEPVSAVTVPDDHILIKTNISVQFPFQHFYISQGYHSFHRAIDLATAWGTPIRPIANGKIEIISYNSFGLGNYIVIRHSASFYSVYAHLSKINVKRNQSVNQEDIIGNVGSTGHSTGPHLHLETIVDNQKINPLTILPKK